MPLCDTGSLVFASNFRRLVQPRRQWCWQQRGRSFRNAELPPGFQEPCGTFFRSSRIRGSHKPRGSALQIKEHLIAVALLLLLLFSWTQLTDAQTSNTGLARAEALIGQGKFDEAVALLESISKDQPLLPGVQAKLGKIYYKKRNLHEAIARLKAALEQNPEDTETAQLLGLAYYSVGQWEHAIPLLEKIQSKVAEPESDGLYLLGVCYLKTQQPDKARSAFARMFSVSPDGPTAHLLFAQMMVRQHLEEKAVAELEKAISGDPRLPMAHFLLGEIYLYQSNPKGALEELKKELEINPSVWLVYWRLGDAHARLGNYGDAEKILKQAIWLNDSFTGAYLLLGEVELKKGDAELAAGFLERALKLDPQNSFVHYSLAKAYQQLGRAAEANHHFEITRSLRAGKKSEEQSIFQETTR